MKINYAEEIEKCRPVLHRYMRTGDKTELRGELQGCDASTVFTCQLVMFIGRNLVYNRNGRKKPYKHPDKVLQNWACGVPAVREENKHGQIEYLLGKIDLYEFLKRGMQVLGIGQ